MIEAKIVADSVSDKNKRITTFVLTYPRFIHSEFMTHRMFSRNASSSRAIPVKKQIQMVIDNPAIPLAFTKNKAGMQGGKALSGNEHQAAVDAWLEGRDLAVTMANKLADLEVHKQYANRILEPYAHITVVCTATEFANFFALRLHPMAQPEICELARLMWEAYKASEPKQISGDGWHLPFIDEDDKKHLWETLSLLGSIKVDREGYTSGLIRMSVARCARVSYLNHDGKKPTIAEDMSLYNRLLGQLPIHASPAEHQASPMWNAGASGNFIGWNQYRKLLPGENITKFEGPSDN